MYSLGQKNVRERIGGCRIPLLRHPEVGSVTLRSFSSVPGSFRVPELLCYMLIKEAKL